MRWRDTFLKEKLTLFSNGYVYHPRFLLYRVSLGGAFKQEEYQSSSRGPRLETEGTAWEYDAALALLPEHPYSLELFASRYEPLFKEQFATQHGSVDSLRGLDFRYRRSPFLAHARYTDHDRDAPESSSDTERLTLDGHYSRRSPNGDRLAFDLAFNPSRFRTSAGLRGDSRDALLGAFAGVGRWRLSAGASQSAADQEGPAASTIETEQLAWYGAVNVDLPMNLRSRLAYRFQDGRTALAPAGGEQRREIESQARDLDFDLEHELYQSLESTYTLRRNETDSSGGATTSLQHGLGFDYTKTIPHGRLRAGLQLGTGEIESVGRTDVIEEGHPATAVPGSFLLTRRSIERSSIAVFVRSPVLPFELIRLAEGVHYALVPVGDGFEVAVFSLPPQFVLPGAFELRVSYSLLAATFRLRSETLGHNASVDLFANRLTPYYSFVAVSSEVLAGALPGSGFDSETFTTGVMLHAGPLRLRGEYQDVDWDINSYHAWRGELQYSDVIGPRTTARATATHTRRYYEQRRAEQGAEELSSALSGSVQQQLFSRRLSVAAGGTYSRLESVITTDAYSLSLSLNFDIGQLDVAAGASAYHADSEAEASSTSRDHRYYYLKVRRFFF